MEAAAEAEPSGTLLSITFGEFELDERLCTLRESGRCVVVQPKVFDLLVYLVRHRDRVVPKQELLDAVWRHVSVGESSLTRAVNLARLALHDDGRRQRIIQTVARRGYRFVAPARDAALDDSSGALPHASMREPPVLPERVFVGRDGVMARLEGLLQRALAGEGCCVAIGGEPGIGKTRILEELAQRGRRLGAAPLLGWCYEGEGAPPYWPWVQILRAQLQEHRAEALRDQIEPGEELLALLPELGATSGSTLRVRRGSPPENRFHLFESLSRWLAVCAARQPLVLVLDDLHAADPSSLRMLEFVARQIRRSPILLAVAYRDDALGDAHPLRRTLALLARQSASTRIALQGLSREDVGRLVESLSGVTPGERLVDAIHERTAGNPFFVHEVVLALAAEDRLGECPRVGEGEALVPPAARDVIGQRLLAVAPDCRQLLETAAVVGTEFDLRVLLAVSNLEEERAIQLLDEARRAELLHEHPRRIGSYRFRHALVQEALYSDQSRIHRSRQHRAIGEALLELGGDGPEAPIAALAHHFCRGARPGEGRRAIAFAREAARRAMRLLAYEEAARHTERALEAFELAESSDEVLRAELLIEQGRALVRGGDLERAEQVLGRAAGVARELSCPILLAGAALTLAGDAPKVAGLAPVAVDLLQEALAFLGDRDAALRVRMLYRLCGHLAASGQVDEAAALGDEAVALASRVSDAALRVTALNARNSVRTSWEGPRRRSRRAREAIDCAEQAGLDGAQESHLHLAAALLEEGDLGGFEAAMAAYTLKARDDPPDLPAWYGAVGEAMRLSLRGHLEEADARAHAALAMGRRLRHPDALLYFGIQLIQIRFLQGRLEETRELASGLAARNPGVPGVGVMLALVDSQSERLDEARSVLASLASNDFGDVPRDAGYASSLSLSALVCSAAGDAATAERLYRRMEPLRGRNACAFTVASNGAVDHFLGLLALKAGRMDRARRDLRAALEQNRRMGAVPWEMQGRLALARALERDGAAGADAERLARTALEGARSLGMAHLAEEAERWLARQVALR